MRIPLLSIESAIVLAEVSTRAKKLSSLIFGRFLSSILRYYSPYLKLAADFIVFDKVCMRIPQMC